MSSCADSRSVRHPHFNAHHERKPPPMAIRISTLFETVSIGFAFALRSDQVISCSRCRRKMLTFRPTIRSLHDLEFQCGARFTLSRSSATLQIPIANYASPTAAVSPAVSSIELCPTPAQRATSKFFTPVPQGRHRTKLNGNGSCVRNGVV